MPVEQASSEAADGGHLIRPGGVGDAVTANNSLTPLALSIDLLALAAVAATLAGFGGDVHWLLDLTAHFRWYWFLAASGCLVAAAWQRRWLAATLAVSATLINLWFLLPYWVPSEQGIDTGTPLEIVSLNLLADNPATDRVLAYLRTRDADVVVLLEVSEAWAEALGQLDTLYPYRVIEPRDDMFGIALLSQWPLAEPRVLTPADGPPAIVAVLEREESACLLVAAHPPAPISAEWTAWRDAQLAALGQLVAAADRPTILAGDLNTTPWSGGFRRLLATSGLRDSALGQGIQATWNAHRPVPRIPIDHVLVSPEIRVVFRGIGRSVGSDHLPVEARLVVP
jgi:endonuclease/exonuclease/phosphatase (EEP) superfamily protein YafD